MFFSKTSTFPQMETRLSKLDAIFEWNMSTPEAETYKLALMWEVEIRKYAPTHLQTPEWKRRNSLPFRGDPRKSILFKHCWKLRRLTKGLLKENELRLYIVANLTILRNYNAYMEVNTLCGDKAWIRWKVWKKLYDRKTAELNSSPPPPVAEDRLMRELLRTKRFFYEKCEGLPSIELVQKFIDAGSIRLWILQGKLSIYYVMLSPFFKQHAETLGKECNFDPVLFKEKITNDIIDYFNYEFADEVST